MLARLIISISLLRTGDDESQNMDIRYKLEVTENKNDVAITKSSAII